MQVSSLAIARRILIIRGHKALIDADLAVLYGVSTKRLNQQVKRNQDRFPADFVFQLNRAERDEVVANCDHLARLRFSPTLPYVFTERRLDSLETKYDRQFKAVFDAIRELVRPAEPQKRKRIGFVQEN